MPALTQEGDWSILPLSTMLQLKFGTVPMMWHVLLFMLLPVAGWWVF
jgi:hypothetical protein